MKPWQILLIGLAALIALMLLPFYESFIAGAMALLIITIVLVGFCLQPRQNFYRVHTKAKRTGAGGRRFREQELLAVKLELARLWLLFVPTMIAVCFLVVTVAHGSTWHFKLLDRWFNAAQPYSYIYVRVTMTVVAVTITLLTAWLSERWVLRDVTATYAMSASVRNGRLTYVFLNKEGSYYGGETFPFGASDSALRRIVFYNERDPERNKITGGLLFHRVIVLGRGLTDLDYETTEAHLQRAQPGLAET
ncbi:MAG: hypothetical protein ACXVZV_14445 [Terriglobales bacterium]